MIFTKKAFTLVELIVVITILAILSTIGFVSYNSYLSGVRDTNRISSLSAISNGLEIYETKNTLPYPDDYIEVKSNGTIIGYQGYAGSSILETIDYSKDGKDPKDAIYYSYYLTKDKKHHQLLAFLEEENNLETYNSSLLVGEGLEVRLTHAIDYTSRYPKVVGDKLGILTQSGTNIPIQEIGITDLDIVTTTDSYTAILSDFNKISGTGASLIAVLPNASCRRIIQMGEYRGPNEYIIKPYGENITVYCDSDYPNENFYGYIEDGDFENSQSSNWSNYTKVTDDNYSATHSLKVTGNKILLSNNFTYIDPSKRYKLEGYFKSSGSINSRLYFGFKEFDKRFNFISNSSVNNVLGTESVLLQDVNSTDMSVMFSDTGDTCTNWQNGGYFSNYASIAFNIDDSGDYNDLPNNNRSSRGFSSISDNGSSCTLNLNEAVGKTYSSGTKIRMHSAGATYNYRSASDETVPTTWEKYSGEILGISKYGVNSSYFRKGTKFIKIMILANYQQGTDAVLYIDDLKLVEY